jgi:hypothetical protein
MIHEVTFFVLKEEHGGVIRAVSEAVLKAPTEATVLPICHPKVP